MPPKSLHLTRHGQALHNISNDFSLPDPVLTSLGHSQCVSLRSSFPYHNSVTSVLCSPLTRTIQTAAEGFGPALARDGVRLVCVGMAQEISGKGCDVGVAKEEVGGVVRGVLDGVGLGGMVERGEVDLGAVEEGWNSKKGIYAPTLRAVEARAKRLRQWLFQWPEEEEIVLVSHGAFLHYLTDDWSGFDAVRGTAYHNCEFRTWRFTADSTAEDPRLEVVGGQDWARMARPEWVNKEDLEEDVVLSGEGVFERKEGE